MADYDPERPNVATGRGTTKKSKKKSSGKPAHRDTGGYDWGDGNKVHSVSRENRDKNRAATAAYGIGPQTPLDAPLTSGQAYAMAEAAANRTFKPQMDANQQMQTNAPAWYQGYVDRSVAANTAQQAQAQPILDTAQAAVGNAAATAPGLDPSSPQYAKEVQAAAGRQTMAQDSANYLAAIPTATTGYLAGQQAIAARELPQVLAGLVQQYGQLGSQRADAVTAGYGDIRTGEQNYGIANRTLGLNTNKAAADVDISRGVDPVTGKPLPADAPTGYGPGAPGMNKYGYTADEWAGLSDAKKNAERNPKPKTPSKTKEQAAEDKRLAGVRKATGTFQSRVGDAQDSWDRYTRAKNPVKDKDGNPVPGKFTKATPDQIKAQMRKDGYSETEIHVMLVLRGKKTLSPDDVKRIKAANPDVRIPRAWLRGKTQTAPHPGTNKAPSGYGDQQRPT